MSSHDPFGFLKHKKGRESNWQFDSRPLKVGNQPYSLCASGMPHTIGKILKRAITFLYTLSQLEVWRSYGPPKLQGCCPLPGTENTIRVPVVASPKFGLWWVLWVRVCMWLMHAPKVLQLCTNELVVLFVQVRVSNWLAYHSS
jgi:hypothetical protein